ncbi:MAG: hypothetical protein GQ527_05150 [Bacteroidales bacterium]|nr:hypothetical protein [Bacteroidales bacterium]
MFFALISLFGLSVSGQEVDSSRYQATVDMPFELEKQEKEKVHIDHDLRIGIDISTLIIGAIAPYRTGLDLSLEYNLKPNIYILVEGGHQYFKKDELRITYISQGNYIRAGLDYNLREPKGANDHDIYYIGFRYGFSKFTQEVPQYLLVNGFWGNTTSSFDAEDGYAHWAEIITGFKVEIVKNWFLGLGLRMKFLLDRSKTNIEPVQYIPGYARNYNTGVMDFNYTIYYNIPLNYQKKKIAVYEK